MMTLQCPECGWTKELTEPEVNQYLVGVVYLDCPNCGFEWDPEKETKLYAYAPDPGLEKR